MININPWITGLTIANTLLILILHLKEIHDFLIKPNFQLRTYPHPYGNYIDLTIIVENRKTWDLFERKATNCRAFMFIKRSETEDDYNYDTKGKTPLIWEETEDNVNEIASDSEGNLQCLRYNPKEPDRITYRLKHRDGTIEEHHIPMPDRNVDIRIEITSEEKTIHRWLRNIRLPDQIINNELPEFNY